VEGWVSVQVSTAYCVHAASCALQLLHCICIANESIMQHQAAPHQCPNACITILLADISPVSCLHASAIADPCCMAMFSLLQDLCAVTLLTPSHAVCLLLVALTGPASLLRRPPSVAPMVPLLEVVPAQPLAAAAVTLLAPHALVVLLPQESPRAAVAGLLTAQALATPQLARQAGVSPVAVVRAIQPTALLTQKALMPGSQQLLATLGAQARLQPLLVVVAMSPLLVVQMGA
jgi:hypothetical protein